MNLLVVGAGAMGSQIAMVSALAGEQVSLYDVEESMLDKSEAELRERMISQVGKGRRNAEDVEAAFSRLTFQRTDLLDAASIADLVIEAVVEKLDVKREIFELLGRVCPPSTVLASNSSSFVPSLMAAASGRPDRMCNIHFFNPALIMKCVEVVRGPETSHATTEAAMAFVQRIGKTPVLLEKEIDGFIANRLLNSLRDEAIRLYEGGYASFEAIDTAARTALGYPMGPFELMDLTGVDISYHVKQGRYAASGNPADLPSSSVTELFEAGRLGRKTGRGWYTYDGSGEGTPARATPS